MPMCICNDNEVNPSSLHPSSFFALVEFSFTKPLSTFWLCLCGLPRGQLIRWLRMLFLVSFFFYIPTKVYSNIYFFKAKNQSEFHTFQDCSVAFSAMSSKLSKLGMSNEAQVDFFNNLRQALPWGVLGGLFAVLYSMDAHWSRYIFGFAVLHFTGVLPTPPIFKFLYRIYCSESIGYKYVRPRLHARMPASHAEYFPAVRSLRKGNGLICKSQRELSAELRRLAETSSSEDSSEADVLILPIPVLNDNYAYALVYPSSAPSSSASSNATTTARLECALIDAADPHRIILELERQLILAGLPEASPSSTAPSELKITLNISHIFTTHKHWDHAGGNKELFDMAQQQQKALGTIGGSGVAPPLIDSALRKELVARVNQIEAERRRTERRRKNLEKLNKPREEVPLNISSQSNNGGNSTSSPNNSSAAAASADKPLALDLPELSDDTDDEGMGSGLAGLTVGTKYEKVDLVGASKKNKEKKTRKVLDPFRYFFAEADEEKVRGLITFSKDLPFVGSKIDNPHCTNTFVNNYDHIHLGKSSSSSSVATVTVMDSPGHTCGSVMFLLSLSESAEKVLFTSETTMRETAAKTAGKDYVPSQMAHTIHRAVFTGDCIFCGGCGAMFETKTAADTIKTYDCFMGSALTAHPLRRGANGTTSAASEESNTEGEKENGETSAAAKTTTTNSPDFYISSRNVLMYVGHEYTLKLMSEQMEMVLATKDKLIKASEAEAKKEIEEKRASGELPPECVDADEAAMEKWKQEKRRDISTVALEEILDEMSAKSGNHKEKKKKDKDGLPAKPTKVLPMRPHHAAIEERWAQIMHIHSTYHPNAATVPSSLYEERRTNPLLTLERSVLVNLQRINAHASRIEEAVYGSDERRSKL